MFYNIFNQNMTSANCLHNASRQQQFVFKNIINVSFTILNPTPPRPPLPRPFSWLSRKGRGRDGRAPTAAACTGGASRQPLFLLQLCDLNHLISKKNIFINLSYNICNINKSNVHNLTKNLIV